MVRIHNTETNEIIDREMNDIEFAHYESIQELNKQKQIEADSQAAAKAELLARLGITQEEAQLLLA
jgi:hypothetical protein